MLNISAKVVASCFALFSFAAAALINFSVGNSIATIIIRATGVMLVCWVIGAIVGNILQKTLTHHIQDYKRKHPIEGDSSSPSQDDQAEPAAPPTPHT